MNITTKTQCKLVGSTFLLAVTLVEIALFCNIFNITDAHWGKLLAVIVTTAVFNGALWWFASLYNKAQNTLTD